MIQGGKGSERKGVRVRLRLRLRLRRYSKQWGVRSKKAVLRFCGLAVLQSKEKRLRLRLRGNAKCQSSNVKFQMTNEKCQMTKFKCQRNTGEG
jgi:hypothetical protein